jgi:putative FmdB family regulatory protein
MPLYEFRCPEGHDFEKFYRSIGAARAEEQCPECGAPAERVMSPAGLVFRGSGFYITDYGKDGKKAERDAAKAAAAKPETPAAETKAGDGTPKPDSAPTSTSTAAPAESKPAPVSPKPAPAGKKE